jgi:hypothetical protein
VGASRIVSDLCEHTLRRAAARSGWNEVGNAWYPIEEPLPPMGGEPPSAEIGLVLKSIRFGWIVVEVKAGEQSAAPTDVLSRANRHYANERSCTPLIPSADV